jgi:erythromycin esterase-like protein
MSLLVSIPLSHAIRVVARLITGATSDYDELLDFIGDARFVLLGEASRGTHEFYRERALITRRLFRDKGFTAVAVEADGPDAYRVNRYVRGEGRRFRKSRRLERVSTLSRMDVAQHRRAGIHRVAAGAQ